MQARDADQPQPQGLYRYAIDCVEFFKPPLDRCEFFNARLFEIKLAAEDGAMQDDIACRVIR